MITIDANAIVKLAITEKDSERAYSIISSETSKESPLFAPDTHNSPLLTFDKKIISKAEDLGVVLVE